MRAATTLLVGIMAAMAGIATAPPAAQAQAAHASASGSASANVVKPLAVTRISNLDFGMIAATAAHGGKVTVAPFAGTARFHGAARSACGKEPGCAAVHSASFLVTGEPRRRYRVTLPRTAIAHDRDGQAHGLEVVSLKAHSLSLRDGPGEGRLDVEGNDRLEVGGTLVVPPFTAAGHYSATVTMLVSYD